MARTATDDTPATELGRLDERWDKIPPANEELYGDIPDGIYDTVIEDARLTETASSGRPVVVWTLRISGPQAVNRVVTKNRVITENTLAFLKEDLDKCRLTVARLSELPERLKELTGRAVPILKRTKDGRANIYFRWESRRPADAGPADDIPF